MAEQLDAIMKSLKQKDDQIILLQTVLSEKRAIIASLHSIFGNRYDQKDDGDLVSKVRLLLFNYERVNGVENGTLTAMNDQIRNLSSLLRLSMGEMNAEDPTDPRHDDPAFPNQNIIRH